MGEQLNWNGNGETERDMIGIIIGSELEYYWDLEQEHYWIYIRYRNGKKMENCTGNLLLYLLWH